MSSCYSHADKITHKFTQEFMIALIGVALSICISNLYVVFRFKGISSNQDLIPSKIFFAEW